MNPDLILSSEKWLPGPEEVETAAASWYRQHFLSRLYYTWSFEREVAEEGDTEI